MSDFLNSSKVNKDLTSYTKPFNNICILSRNRKYCCSVNYCHLINFKIFNQVTLILMMNLLNKILQTAQHTNLLRNLECRTNMPFAYVLRCKIKIPTL